MGAFFSSVWSWAVEKFNQAIAWVKSLWERFLDLLCSVKDSVVSLLSNLKLRFCHVTETTSLTTTWATVPSSQGKVEVRQGKIEFEFELGNQPTKQRSDEVLREMDQQLKTVKKCKEYFTELEAVMEEDLRASSRVQADKTQYKIKQLLDSGRTSQLIEDLGRANQSIL